MIGDHFESEINWVLNELRRNMEFLDKEDFETLKRLSQKNINQKFKLINDYGYKY